ncbi:hypothetical protein TRIUR3_28723 [Triticum urartu]|uniref:Uncharacterized protein n=1 Tax=Triticum urartu TaxID=4572 RepID=M7ZWB8_TRIUA|nr:hypothetical protein TRIUR3_28723 [Triticum urartu]
MASSSSSKDKFFKNVINPYLREVTATNTQGRIGFGSKIKQGQRGRRTRQLQGQPPRRPNLETGQRRGGGDLDSCRGEDALQADGSEASCSPEFQLPAFPLFM